MLNLLLNLVSPAHHPDHWNSYFLALCKCRKMEERTACPGMKGKKNGEDIALYLGKKYTQYEHKGK